MSTYNQNFRSEPYYGHPGPGRRGRRRGSIAEPRNTFRRRLGAMVMLGILAAPVVWATRDDGQPVGVAYTGGAAAVMQFDPTAGSTSVPSVVAPPAIEVPTSPPPAPEELVEVADDVDEQVAAEPVAAQVVECLSYTVQSGDSWYGIADKAGVKAGEIAGRNGMTLQSNLLIGSEICLPPGATVPPIKTTSAPQTTQAPKCSGKYTVRAGDSWSLIASRHSVTSTDLAAANNKTVRSTLLIGDVLCLPLGAKAPSATQPPSGSSGSSGGSSSGGSTRTYTREELEQIVRDVWPDELEKNAFYVAHRESRWTPNVKNAWPSREHPCCYGLFQINWTAHKSWLAGYGVTTPTQLFDPVINTKMAYVIYQRANGWTPWWTSGWRP